MSPIRSYLVCVCREVRDKRRRRAENNSLVERLSKGPDQRLRASSHKVLTYIDGIERHLRSVVFANPRKRYHIF